MFRHGSYNAHLAHKLQNSEFAREFLLSLMEGDDGLPLLEALKHTIRRMGVKEFATVSGIPAKSISRMLSSDKIPRLETLNRYCAPFGLRVCLTLRDVA